MRLLDRYIAREYLRTFMMIVLSFSIVILVIDLVDQAPRLIRYGANFNQAVQFFLLRIPYLIVLTSPVAVLLAGLFLMNTLSRYNESIAIRASGISIARMVMPLFVIGFIFSIFIGLFGEFVLPEAEAYRDYLKTVKIKKQQLEDIKMRNRIHYRGNNGTLYFIGFFDGYRNTLKTVDITDFNQDTGKPERKINAEKAIWNDWNWEFINGQIITFDESNLPKTQVFEKRIFKDLDVKPEDFVKSSRSPEEMNYIELRDYIKRLEKTGESAGRERTQLHFKLSFPFANFIILLFCVPLASASTRSKGRGIIFLFGLIICFLFLSSLRVSQSLGFSGALSPWLAAWLPNIIFAAAGLISVIKSEI
ncbi:MAG: LPS export ABC transporter permease LptG [Candidatus Cloacimonadota bacterium]|nr:MAG: LPS export ABC transporter permease LptG [Candidatus Cloacimonadota bacterium]